MTIHTARLTIIPATAELVRLESTDREAFGHALSAEVPWNWPPDQVRDALPWFLKQLNRGTKVCVTYS